MHGRALLGLVVLAAALGCGGDGPDTEEALRDKTLDVVATSGPFAAVDLLKAQSDPVLAVRTVNAVILHLFHAKGDLAAALTVGRAGLGMAKERADALAETDAIRAREIRALMRHIAWNIAMFTWPGWGREDIVLRKGDLEVGMKAARMSLEMAQSLELTDADLSSSWWLLGAHLMAAGEHSAAYDAMKRAAELAPADREVLLSGYLGIALMLRGPRHKAEGEEIYENALSRLEGTEDGSREAFTVELQTVRRVLLREGKAAVGAARTVTAGPVTLEIVASKSARHFAVMSHLARGLYPRDAFPLTDDDQKRLDRFAGLIARKPGLGRFFFTREEPAGALFEAAGAGVLSLSEVTDISKTFESFAARIDALLESRRLDGESFAASLDLKRLVAVAVKASTFTTVKALTVPVWPVPAEPGKPRCRFEDGRIVIEVNPHADPTADLVYGVAHAFVDRRTKEFLPKYREAVRQIGSDTTVDQVVAAIGSLLMDADPKAEERNFHEPLLPASFRLVLEVEEQPLDLSADDPFAEFVSRAFRVVDVSSPDAREPK